jgi:hypothetical protein
MGGTKAGGLKASRTNKEKYGENFYAIIGAEGGKKGHTGGFAYWKSIGRNDLIASAGRRGGQIGHRGRKEK